MDRSTVKCILVLLLTFGIIRSNGDLNEKRTSYSNTKSSIAEQRSAHQETATTVATTKIAETATAVTTTAVTTTTVTETATKLATTTSTATTAATTKATEKATSKASETATETSTETPTEELPTFSTAVSASTASTSKVPDEPTDFHATVNDSSTITLFWSPSKHLAGPTNYSIVVNGNVDQRTGSCIEMKEIYVEGFNTSSVVVDNLCSFTFYNFTIMASTSAENSSIVSINQTVQTAIGIPDEPTDFHATVNDSSTITLFWSPSKHLAGPTNYSIVVNGNVNQRTDSCIEMKEIYVEGFNTSSVVVENLCSFTFYNFTIMASTSAENSSIVTINQTVQTAIGIPDEPTDFHATVNDSSTITLFWSPSKHLAGPTNYSIVVNGNVYRRINNCIEMKVINVQGFDTSSVVVDNLCSYTCYSFTITASTSAGNFSSVALNKAVRTEIGTPPKEISEKVFNPAAEKKDSITDSTFLVSVNIDLLTDSTNGPIVMTGLLVTKDKAVVDIPKNKASLKNWRGWGEWKRNYNGTYRPTPENWLRKSSELETSEAIQNGHCIVEEYDPTRDNFDDDDGRSSKDFIVGADSNCENIEEVHCNGPVEAETTYWVISVSCTTAGCSSSTPFGPFKTKAKSIVAAVVGGVLAALVVVGVVIGGLVYRRRRNRKQLKYVDDACVEKEVKESVDKNRPKKIRDFSRLVDNYQNDSGRLFSMEWLELGQCSPSHPYTNAKLAVNRLKNRYTNILAYDHTRVKLLPKTEEEGADYINANYIPGYNRPREYIASQGPVPKTVDDFWQMIWEQNVPIIVQLTDLFEKGKSKLAQYWPEEVNKVMTYGDLKVEIVSISPMTKYTIKMFRVELGSKSRQVKHFFLQGWQDYNANLKTGDVIDFTRYVRNELKPTDKGPMVVHCSAGVGRTGTFICVDYFLQVIDKADLEDSIDIFSFVLKMRDCRPMMVQSENQYIFVHDAVKEMIERKRTALAGEEDEVIYENQAFDPNEDGDDNIYENV